MCDIWRCGANIIIGSYGRIRQNLKNNFESLFLSCYYLAYNINLAAPDISKTLDPKVIFVNVNILLNEIVYFFNMASKRKYVLTALQRTFFNGKKTINQI
jgi:hypothetical protein